MKFARTITAIAMTALLLSEVVSRRVARMVAGT